MSLDTQIFNDLSSGNRPSPERFKAALETILAGNAEPLQISALLLGLNVIGLTSQEIRVGTEVMRSNMIPVDAGTDIIDIVGTGGTGLHTLSISTATAFVCAGAGAKVAKHGNRAASSLTGTADTLSTLGVNLGISPEKAAECVREAGIGFLFAPNHHPAMRHVGPARKALGVRTLFNMLGPLCNPAGAKRMLLGVCDDGWRRPMAEALAELGSTHIWVVHGDDGLDEISTTSPTHVSEVKDGQVKDFVFDAAEYGFPRAAMADIRGGEPKDNAAALNRLLGGETGPYRDIVTINAGAALMIAGVASDLQSGFEKAKISINSGAAKAALEKLIAVSNRN